MNEHVLSRYAQRQETIALEAKPKQLRDVYAYLEREVSGKDVLNIGAAGDVYRQLPKLAHEWPHARLAKVAHSITGIDIDKDAIAYCASHGWSLLHGDCETFSLDRKFDCAVMTEVIEHVEAPGRCIKNIVRHLRPSGRLYMTTPNPTYLGDVVRLVKGRGPSVYWDHQAIFAPEHIKGICDRSGLKVEEIFFFTSVDNRTSAMRLKSQALKLASRLFPRTSSSFLAVVSLPGGAQV